MPASPGGIASRLIKHLSRARKSLPAPSSSSRGTTTRPYDELKQAAKDVWRSTFGQLEREPAYETIPLRRGGTGGRRFPNGQYWNAREIHTSSVRARQTGGTNGAPLVQNAKFLVSRIRPQPHTLRGPGMVGHAGLLPCPARTFATYGSAKFAHEIVGNVPLGFRALADRMKRKERVERQMSWRNKVRESGRGGKVERSLKRFEKMRGGSRFVLAANDVERVDKEIKRVNEYKRYFPLPQLEVSSIQIKQDDDQPLLTSSLTTIEESTPTYDPRSTTYLLLPLSPSLAHLISLTPQPLRQSDQVDDYFHPHHPERMTHAFPALTEAYTHHARALGPTLEALGKRVHLRWEDCEPWLDRVGAGEKESVQVRTILDGASGEAEALRLCFDGWTRSGVERLIRGLDLDLGLAKGVDGKDKGEEWWYCYTVPSDPIDTALSESGSISLSFSFSDQDVSSFSSPSRSMCESILGSSPSISSQEEQEEGQMGLTWEESVWRMPSMTERGETGVELGLELDLERVESSVWSEL